MIVRSELMVWERRWQVDAAVAATVAAVQLAGTWAVATHRSSSVNPFGYAMLALGAAALVARRRAPVTVLGAAYLATFCYRLTGNSGGVIWLAVIVAFGTAIYLRRRAAAVGFLVIGYVTDLWGPAMVHGDLHRAPSAVFALSLGAGLGVLLAGSEWIRLRRQRAVALAHGREQEMLRRVSEERLRMARDLHDVIAHSISVINVQANTALHLMDRQPERARLALSAINDVSKQTLSELRAVLGVLRPGEHTAPRAPAPSLARLADLVAGSGLRVRVEQHGEPVALPAEVDLAAYRIVQEALTNTARHSGRREATVRIEYGTRDLRVVVDDDGDRPARADGTGNGIRGMRERVHGLGGELAAAPRPEGGFRVWAVLPLATAPVSET
jgi:signal transduction histidine kinase